MNNFSSQQLDDLYDLIDDMFHSGNFLLFSRYLDDFDLTNSPNNEILALMIHARIASDKINNYHSFIIRSVAELESRQDFDQRAIFQFKKELL